MYKRGQWLAVCDVCGLQYHSGQMRKRWDGLMVCKDDYETRHPQEFIRPVIESTPEWTRRPQETNISPFDYTDFNYDTDDAQFPNDPRYTTRDGT